jgi:hypothetical protein
MKYTSDNHRPIISDDMHAAAATFAARKARTAFGESGHARTCHQVGYRSDGSAATYSAFIGSFNPKTGNTAGHNVTFTVEVEKAPRLHSNLDSRTPAQRDAYDEGQDDCETGNVDDLRAMRCEFYAAGARSAHYTAAEQG